MSGSPPRPAAPDHVERPAGEARPAGMPRLSEPLSRGAIHGPGGRRDVDPAAVEELATALADAAAEAWGAALTTHNRDSLWLRQLVAGHRRELWLWLVGERRWEPVEAGLAGRVARRLPPE